MHKFIKFIKFHKGNTSTSDTTKTMRYKILNRKREFLWKIKLKNYLEK